MNACSHYFFVHFCGKVLALNVWWKLNFGILLFALLFANFHLRIYYLLKMAKNSKFLALFLPFLCQREGLKQKRAKWHMSGILFAPFGNESLKCLWRDTLISGPPTVSVSTSLTVFFIHITKYTSITSDMKLNLCNHFSILAIIVYAICHENSRSFRRGGWLKWCVINQNATCSIVAPIVTTQVV